MEQQDSEKLRLSCIAANILDWYRNRIIDAEEDLVVNNSTNPEYPYYDRHTLRDKWKFWTSNYPNEDNQAEMEVFEKLLSLFTTLNKLQGYETEETISDSSN